jgi:DNA-binding winged helix-turn-helix (wHTH) protein/tetratricopeptide (TPR) repeat protein
VHTCIGCPFTAGSPLTVCFTVRMVWEFGGFELIESKLELRCGAVVVPMEPQVFDVLKYLVAHNDRVVSKEELLDNIWGSRFVSESALTSRIKDARRALGDDGRTQQFIRTFHGRGYRFIHPVTQRPEHPSSPSGPLPSDNTVASLLSSGARVTELSLAVDREFPFVGRSDTIERALELGADAIESPQALLLGGEPGIGKSRVALEIAGRLGDERGFAVIGGRCEHHLASSLQPWLEALTPYLEHEAEEQLRADTVGLLDHLRAFLPALETRLSLDEPVAMMRNDEYAVIDAIATLIERISSRQPLVAVLDDIQWAGGATRALASLVMRRGEARVLLVLTFRTTVEDLDITVREWLDALVRAGAHREDLAGLSAEDVDQLVGEVLGETVGHGLARSIWDRSEGHSLFAVELIRDFRTGRRSNSLPPSVSSLVQSRLAKLPDTVAKLVVAGAVLGQEFDLAIAAAAADLDDVDVLDAVDGAVGAQLLHEDAGRIDWYRFSHQLVPAAALDSISSSRRVRLHAKVAEELERREASSFEVAHHLLEASPLLDIDEVVMRVRSISDAALLLHQYDRAVELLDRTSQLRLDPRIKAEVLTQYGAACNLAGQQPRALGALTSAANLARKNGWDDILAAAALGMWGQSPFRASRDQTVIPLLDEAIGRSQRIDDHTRARLIAKRAAFNLFSGPMEERDRLSAAALDLVGNEVSAARLEVLEARWMAIASPTMLAPIVELDVELDALRKELGALTTDACAPEISIYWRGMGDELVALTSELREDPRQRREVDQWRTTALDGAFALFEGDFERARFLTDRALPLGEEPWGEAGQVVHALVHLLIDVLEGGSTTAVERWIHITQVVPSDPMRAMRGWAEAQWGDREVADTLVDRVWPRLDLLADNFMGGFGLVGLAEASIVLGRHDVMPALIDTLTPLSEQMLGHPWAPSLAAADPLARLCRLTGDDASAALFADRARALYTRLGATSLRERFDAWFI